MRNPKERLTSHPKRNNICAAITAASLFAAGVEINSAQHDRQTTVIIREDIAVLEIIAADRKRLKQETQGAEEPIIIFDAAVLKKY